MKKLTHFSLLISSLVFFSGALPSCGKSTQAEMPVTRMAASMEEKQEIPVEPILTRQFHGCKAHQ